MSRFPEFVLNHPILFGLLAAVIVFMIVGEIRRKSTAGQVLNVTDAVRLINDREPVIIDLRSKENFKAGHIMGARSIPEAELAAAIDRQAIPADKPVIVYDQNGFQSGQASQRLKTAGFEVYILQQGLMGWQQDSLPLETR